VHSKGKKERRKKERKKERKKDTKYIFPVMFVFISMTFICEAHEPVNQYLQTVRRIVCAHDPMFFVCHITM
jgi:hypothetical protein